MICFWSSSSKSINFNLQHKQFLPSTWKAIMYRLIVFIISLDRLWYFMSIMWMSKSNSRVVGRTNKVEHYLPYEILGCMSNAITTHLMKSLRKILEHLWYTYTTIYHHACNEYITRYILPSIMNQNFMIVMSHLVLVGVLSMWKCYTIHKEVNMCLFITGHQYKYD